MSFIIFRDFVVSSRQLKFVWVDSFFVVVVKSCLSLSILCMRLSCLKSIVHIILWMVKLRSRWMHCTAIVPQNELLILAGKKLCVFVWPNNNRALKLQLLRAFNIGTDLKLYQFWRECRFPISSYVFKIVWSFSLSLFFF